MWRRFMKTLKHRYSVYTSLQSEQLRAAVFNPSTQAEEKQIQTNGDDLASFTFTSVSLFRQDACAA